MSPALARPRLVLIADGALTPSFFLRVRQPAEAAGLPFTFACADTLLQRHIRRVGRADLDAIPMLAHADVVMFQRATAAAGLDVFRVLRKAGKPLIYKTDDLLQELPPWSSCPVSVREKAAIEEMIAGADLVTCSTQALGGRLRALNEHVRVIENYALPMLWKSIPQRLQ